MAGEAAVDDAQKQYFERGRMQGIFNDGLVEVAMPADPKEVSGLKEPKKVKSEEVRELEDPWEQEGSVIVEEGELTIE